MTKTVGMTMLVDMTIKMTVSLPDELGLFLKSQGNASAYVAESVRRRRAADQTREALAAVGITEVPAAEIERFRRANQEILARTNNPARRAELAARLEELTRRPER